MDRSKLNIVCRKITRQYQKVYMDSLVSVILYGSYARGEQQIDSDLDIVAIVKGERIDLQKKLEDVWKVTNEIGIDEDIVISANVIPFSDFIYYKDSLPYYSNIEKEGVRFA